MALIQCPECSKEISDAAQACHQCGYPIAKSKGENEGIQPQQSKEEPVRCPKCGSAQITTGRRGGGIAVPVPGSIVIAGSDEIVSTCIKCGHGWTVNKTQIREKNAKRMKMGCLIWVVFSIFFILAIISFLPRR